MRLTSVLIFCWLFLVIGASAQDAKSALTPNELYSRAWKLVENDYYDPKFNGQNWHRWEHRYDGKLITIDDARVAIGSMLASLGDPKTKLRLPHHPDNDSTDRDGRYVGLGMHLFVDNSKNTIIMNVTDDSPAFKAGIRAGNQILQVNGESIKGLSIDQIKQRMVGPANSEVVLTIEDDSVVRTISVLKAVLPLQSVATVTWLPGNLGYLGLDNFSSVDTVEQVRTAVRKLHDCDALILDLRRNPGGLLMNAFAVADLFLDDRKQCIYNFIDRNGYVLPKRASGNQITQQMLVLLIDKGTAEGAEILTAALQDNGRATVLGERTCGDFAGLIQAVNRFDDGSEIDISVARWLTPNQKELTSKGISPDIEVALSARDRMEGKGPWFLETFKLDPKELKDKQLLRAISFLRDAVATKNNSLEK